MKNKGVPSKAVRERFVIDTVRSAPTLLESLYPLQYYALRPQHTVLQKNFTLWLTDVSWQLQA